MIIYGLGNNEEKYLATRHNVGRVIVEELARLSEVSWKHTKQIYHTEAMHTILTYGDGYMNTSGQQLHSYLHYKHIKPDIICIIQDDSDQISGKVKLIKGGGDAGHKGIRDIYKHMLSWGITIDQIWRIKVGIRPPNNTQRSEAFVLSQFTPNEKGVYHDLAQTILKHSSWLSEKHFGKLQNEINSFYLRNSSN